MTFAHLLLVAMVPLSQGGEPQARTLDRGIAAESSGRWEAALSIYREELERNPRQLSLWFRVADIHGRLEQHQELIGALTRAAAVFPNDDSVHLRLSEAYAVSGHPAEAHAAILRALVINPTSVDYLRRHATLATWTGEYDCAKTAYRRLVAIVPSDADAQLGLARTSAWSGDTDAAVRAYRNYLRQRPDHPEVWMELARTESWRGDFAAALDVLNSYRAEFGESPESLRERIGVLARGGRPREATRLMAPALAASPDDAALKLSRAMALAAQFRRSDALAALDSVAKVQPDDQETRGARGVVRTLLASTGMPGGSFYSDSDGLRTWRFDPRVSVAVGDHLRVDGGYERVELRAESGSGLETSTGGLLAHHEVSWAGVSVRTGALVIRGQAGYATAEDRERLAYQASLQFTSDHLLLTGSTDSGFFLVSPRTIGLGLTRTIQRLGIDWSPSLRTHIAMDVSHEEISDGNRRWDLLLTPRRAVVRSQQLNLDLGLQARYMSTRLDLDNGYYDPSRYESYSMAAFPYWKVSEDAGLGGFFAVGVQRDSTTSTFAPTANAAAEATFGIYRNWMLKLNSSMTFNDRLASGAFRGFGGQVVLVRRF